MTSDAAELGRAQAIQVDAADVLVMAEMNPVLLKPQVDYRSQLVVMGRPIDTLDSERKSTSDGATSSASLTETSQARHDPLVRRGPVRH